jgi:iron(III) transport system substrate-binding protein
VAWAPTNGSFQAFVTAMRLLDGEETTRQWLEAMLANDVQAYENNDAIVAAVGSGEVDLGLVNHYYVYEFQDENGGDFAAEDYYFPAPGAGSIINVAGMGILDTAAQDEAAERFLDYMLTADAQNYFAEQTIEYPLLTGVAADARVKPLSEIAAPALDLSNLDDLQGTLQLLQETGAMQ